ncbi:hypothetical protein V6N13_147993 [Hibiscus sabdariffa]
MEGNKFTLVLVAMAVVLLVTVAPTVTAARYKGVPLSIITDPDENCLPQGSFCVILAPKECCSGGCFPVGPGVGMCM